MSPALAQGMTHQRVAMFVGIVLVGFVLVLHGARIAEPWDGSLGGVTSGEYYGYASRGFEAHGLLGLRLRPSLFFLEDSAAAQVPYLNHPSAPHLVTYPAYRYLGRDERALRLPILGLLVITLASTFALVRREAGSTAGWVTVGFLASWPLVIQYGRMVDAPMFSLALLVPGVMTWLAWRRAPSARRYAAYAACAFLGGSMDWFGYFLVPAAWLDLSLARPRVARPCRAAWLAGLPFGLALLLYFAWLAWASGGLGATIDQFSTLLKVPAGLEPDADVLPPWGETMSRWFRRCYGWPGLGLVALGVLGAGWRLLRCAGTHGDEAAILLLVAGLLPAVVFRERAIVHEFWILTSAPGLALAAALGLGVIRTGLDALHLPSRAAATITTAVFVAVAVLAARQGLELAASFRTTEYRDRAAALNATLGPRDVVLMPGQLGTTRYYARAALIPLVDDEAAFREVMRRLAPARHAIDRVFVASPLSRRGDAAWVLSLPLKRDGARQLDFGSDRLAIVEVDKAAVLTR